MNRSRRTSVSGSSARSGLVRILLVLAVVTLVVGLVAQGYAWANPAPVPAAGPLASGGPTLAGLARALATVLLAVVVPLQVLTLVLVVAIRPFTGRARPSRH